MTSESAAAAWRVYIFNWALLAALWLALFAAVLLGGFSFTVHSVLIGWGFVAVYAAFAWYNATSPRRGDPQVVFVLGGFAQIVLVTLIMAPFTYVAAAINLPMQDAALMRLDQMLGLDWLGYVSFVHAHPLLATWIDCGYTMIKWPLFIIPVALAAGYRFDRLQQFTLTFLFGLIITTVVSALVPAIGVYHELGISIRDFPLFGPDAFESQLIDLPRVRDGSLRVLDLGAITGIVTFPSFHAASAALYLWALWPVKLLKPVAIVANVAMLAATPIVGGHYFVDVIAGIVVAALSVVAAGATCRWIAAGGRHGEAAGATVAAEAPGLGLPRQT
jgi:membrane-associated phospholipid phosphatase